MAHTDKDDERQEWEAWTWEDNENLVRFVNGKNGSTYWLDIDAKEGNAAFMSGEVGGHVLREGQRWIVGEVGDIEDGTFSEVCGLGMITSEGER